MKITNIVSSATVLLGAWQAGIVAAVAAEAGGGAPSNSINPLTFDPDLAWFTFIVFVVLLLVLTKFAWKPLLAGLEQRERTIAQMIDDAKRSHDEAAQKLQAYEQKLTEAASEAHEVLVQARRDAAAAGEKMLEAARADANRERLRALADIEAAKRGEARRRAQERRGGPGGGGHGAPSSRSPIRAPGWRSRWLAS